MRKIKALLSVFIILALFAALAPASYAEEGDERFSGKTWEQVMEEFFTEHGTDPERVTAGYYNTVTGEEHYWRGDEYMVSGSMYKIPINMVFTERIYNGEMNWDDQINGLKYEKALEFTIVNSDNNIARDMWNYLGGYQEYRKIICPYMGVDPETVDEMYWKNNYFTAEQMIHCLKTLYEGQERFPGIIDMLLRAEPSNYFKMHQQEYDVAHKYGYLAEGSTLYLNDCGICYTDEPICIVIFTDTVNKPYEVLTEFCTLMCDWAQYHTELDRRLAAEEAEAAAIAELAAAQAPTEEALPEAAPAISVGIIGGADGPTTVMLTKSGSGFAGRLIKLVIIGLLAIFFIYKAANMAEKGKIKIFGAVFAAILCAAAFALCVIAPGMDTVTGKTEGDPAQTVSEFFDCISVGDYDHAYTLLKDCTSLGLEKQPEDEAGRLIYAALKKSYSYKLYGEAVIEKYNAKQSVLLRSLDIDAMLDDLRAETDKTAEALARELDRAEIYDENDEYLPEFTDKVYIEAVKTVLSHAEDYYTTSGIELELVYADESWQIQLNDALTSALTGAAA